MWCDNVKWTKPKQGGSCLTKGSGRACSASKSLLKGLTEGCQVVLSRLNAGMVAGVHPLEESRSVTPVGGYMGWHVYYWPWEWASLIERQVEQKIQSADQGSTSRESGGARVCAYVCVCNERGQLTADRLNLCLTGGGLGIVWRFWPYPCTQSYCRQNK